MQLRIFFNPIDMSVVEIHEDDIYIVIDVIRATTTLATIFDSGAARVYAANTIEQARNGAKLFPQRLLCGERNVQPVVGFDYGNSPAQFSQLDLTECELILTTTNGTRAFYACPGNSVRLAGSFYNARAVTTRALALAHVKGSNIAIVCAAESNYFALDDTTCAGYLSLELQRQQPDIKVWDAVHAAQALYREFAPPKLIEFAHSAREVVDADMGHDLDYCMRIDGSTMVPIIVGQEEETGLLIIEKAK